MISTYQKRIRTNIRTCVLSTLFLSFLCTPFLATAQSELGALSLSVTPTLFEMSANPSQTWNSSVKVINNNQYEITVYANVVNFAPQGETGEGKFIPVFEEATNGTTLAEWITVSEQAVVIPPEESVAIPVRVAVPPDAAPGGHFAAILVGTRPLETKDSLQVRTSQLVTSLFFVRVAGDVIESAKVREFRTTEKIVDTPEVTFEVRFENEGNVHVQPQGDIVITNMWGKERGVIPINHKTHFGNVLPNSIRKFEFTWKGEQSFTDIGRYKAALTLGYGDEGVKYVTSNTYFYVIPIKAFLTVVGSVALIIIVLGLIVKAYVRRMLALAGVDPRGAHTSARHTTFVREGDVRITRASLKAPVTSGVIDLKTRMKNASALLDKFKAFISFVVAYRVFFISSVFILCVVAACVYFFTEVTTEQRDYEVTIENPDTNLTLSSEEILYEETDNEPEAVPSSETFATQEEQPFALILTNSSDTPGLAGRLQTRLEAEGYVVDDLQSDFTESKARSVIVYHIDVQEEALALSRLLGGALLSAGVEEEGVEPSITIYIGNDYAE